jgi:Domain of unknown function (DUF222)
VFENDLVELDAAATLAAAEANERALTAAEGCWLQLAAHWSDLHAGEAVPQSRLRGVEHPVRLGGDGTATVGDFAPAELGGVLGISGGSVSRLIADALDLRHRLPLTWAAILAGQAAACQGRHIAAATRHLTCGQAGLVDHRIAPALGAVSYGRLQTLLEAAIYEADPEGAGRRAAEAGQERFVRLGRSTEHGLKLIIARASAGDAIWFKATIDRIADILGRQGDIDTIEVRRSKAIGILAQPAEALRLLCEHQNDDEDEDRVGEPADPDPEPAGDETDDVDQAAAPGEDSDTGEEPDHTCDIGPVHDEPPTQIRIRRRRPGIGRCRSHFHRWILQGAAAGDRVCASQRRSGHCWPRHLPGGKRRADPVEPAGHAAGQPVLHHLETGHRPPAGLSRWIAMKSRPACENSCC